MPFVSGFLRTRHTPGHRPDHELPGGGGYIDNALPGDQPGIDHELPEPPPGIWPPPSWGTPIVPVDPGFGVGGRPGIDNSLPVQPGTIWPSPGRPIDPGYGRPEGGGGRPDNTLPGGRPGGRPDNTLPGAGGARPDNTLPSKTYWMLCYCPSLGWKYVAVDPSLRPGHDLPGQPVRPDNTLPQTPAPKT